MGIDVYSKWRSQTAEEKQAQYTGFSVVSGHLGYLREAYHGEPYAIKTLLPEGWNPDTTFDDEGYFEIKAATLRERLPVTLEAARQRNTALYRGDTLHSKVLDSFQQFVELLERKEAETGHPCSVMVSY